MRSLIVLSLLATAACGGGRPDAWDASRAIMGPVAMKDRVAYVDGARDRVVVVDASGDTPRVNTFAVGRRPLFAAPTPDRTRLAVVTRGEEAILQGEIDQSPGLYMVDVTHPNAPPIRYEIRSPFDRIAIADDGSVAVAYFSAGGPDADGLFRNPNELAVIDLLSPPTDANPVLRTVRSFGSAPTGVVLSPPMVPHGAPDTDQDPHTFAFIFAPNTLTILDATHPDRREVTIKLASPGTSAIVTPQELVFAPKASAVYLRADGARDVLSVGLEYQAPNAMLGDTNDYRPSLMELGAGAAPADVAVYDDPADGTRRVLAATPGTRELSIIDADTAEFVQVPTDDPIDRILLLPATEPHIALLASLAGHIPRIHLLSLDGIANTLVQPDMRTITLSQPVFDVVGVPGAENELAMIVHDDARTVLGMLDATVGSVAPIEGAGQLDTYDFATAKVGDNMSNYLVGATRGVSRVGIVDLSNLHPEDVRLDAPPMTVFALDKGKVYVDHGDPLGLATLIQKPSEGRSASIVFSGFLIAGLLDDGPQ